MNSGEEVYEFQIDPVSAISCIPGSMYDYCIHESGQETYIDVYPKLGVDGELFTIYGPWVLSDKGDSVDFEKFVKNLTELSMRGEYALGHPMLSEKLNRFVPHYVRNQIICKWDRERGVSHQLFRYPIFELRYGGNTAKIAKVINGISTITRGEAGKMQEIADKQTELKGVAPENIRKLQQAEAAIKDLASECEKREATFDKTEPGEHGLFQPVYDAVSALLNQEVISKDDFDTLLKPWVSVMGSL